MSRIRRGARRSNPDGIDLSGDRAVEWSWIAARIPGGPGLALDFGCGQSDLGLIAAHRGFAVTAVDLCPVSWPYASEAMTFIQGDVFDLPLAEDSFDLVLNCSAVEHVGLSGRYGVDEQLGEGDLAAMTRLRALMKPGATMLLTVPVGRDAVFAPWHRVYGSERLPRLLEGFALIESEYWVKDRRNRWVAETSDAALSAVPAERRYGLGCFTLRRPPGDGRW